MRKTAAKRFGVHEVKAGKHKGGLHVATKRYADFRGELTYLEDYLNRRLLPKEPEDVQIAGIMLNLQSIIEHELELLIKDYVSKNPSPKNQAFLGNMRDGFVAFKNKFTWARAKILLSKKDHDVMEEIRIIRNAQTHIRPSKERPKHKYRCKALLTRNTLRTLFLDVDDLVRRLRAASGNKQKWHVIPPGFAEELGWASPSRGSSSRKAVEQNREERGRSFS
ncbi:MAG TPA: hypothetical protein VF345_14195 [Chthoniobacterales bacterium]